MYFDPWMFCAALVDLGLRREEEDVGQGLRYRSVASFEGSELGAVVVGVHHRGKLGRVVLGFAVVEDHSGEWVRQDVYGRGRERGSFDDASQGVALAAALNAKKADGVGLVEVQGDSAAATSPSTPY